MAFNIFKKEKKPDTKPTEQGQEQAVQTEPAVVAPLAASQGAHEVITNFYVSEKATRLLAQNQYVFKVAKTANKQSVKRHISQLYKVKVTNVQMLNMPSKSRNVGRFTGTKSGFRKAIVTLAKGNTIEQAKP